MARKILKLGVLMLREHGTLEPKSYTFGAKRKQSRDELGIFKRSHYHRYITASN